MIKGIFSALAQLQYKHYKKIIAASIIFTIFMLIGASKIYMQSDITKEFPQDLPIFKLQDKINSLYGAEDSVLITVKIDPNSNIKDGIIDIRDPLVIQSLIYFENVLKEESEVESVTSASLFLKNKPLFTLDMVKAAIDNSPGAKEFFNKDYTATLIIVKAGIGTDINKIRKIVDRFEEDKENSFIPPGIKITVTGTPFVRNTILTFLQQDAIFTTGLAAIIILFLLFILERSITKGLLVFIPLTLGLIWTLGTLGWLNIPISIATVGVGAMILGLGVEYGVFVVSRYGEEREKRRKKDALDITVNEIGKSIFGSGLTTIIGFLALTLSIMPMMQHLGQSLALGIFYSLIAALVINPAIIVYEEDLELTLHQKKEISMKKKSEMLRKRK